MLPSAKCGRRETGYFINGLNVDCDKWPAVVESLLKRTKIYRLSIHRGKDLAHLTPAILSQLKEVFEQNKANLQLEFVDFNFSDSSIEKFQPFLIYSLHSTCRSLSQRIPVYRI